MTTTETGFSITIDDGGLVATLNQMVQKAKNLRPLLKMFQVLMIRSFDLNFRYEGRPAKWAPLLKATIRRKKSSGILKDTGRLRLSTMSETAGGNITKFASDSLIMGTSVPYAKFLQEGTKHMPARPFIIIQKEDAEEMERLTAGFFME
jgi:phage gpG-like protein